MASSSRTPPEVYGTRGRTVVSKRQRLATTCQWSRITTLLEWLPRRDCLIVLNYHRIGQPEDAPASPFVYSTNAEEFERQVSWLRRRYRVATLDEAVAFIEGRASFHDSAVLITFDDGYRDNYDVAFPILSRHGVPGTFFLCTSFVAGRRFPWWDCLAFSLKHARRPRFTLSYPEPMEFDLDRDPWVEVFHRLSAICKDAPGLDLDRFLDGLVEVTGVERREASDRLFLNWDEAARMADAGMSIGAHTHTHPQLANLPLADQVEELKCSRRILEEHLGRPIETLAYPFGLTQSFNADTRTAVAEAGFRAAFSFHGGVNARGRVDPRNVLRLGVEAHLDMAYIRLRLATAALTARWFL